MPVLAEDARRRPTRGVDDLYSHLGAGSPSRVAEASINATPARRPGSRRSDLADRRGRLDTGVVCHGYHAVSLIGSSSVSIL